MIYGTFENANRYFDVLPGLERILQEAARITSQEKYGRNVYLDGEDLFLILSEYDTHAKAAGCTEAHRKYADVMCVIEGEETVCIGPTSDLRHITQPYDAGRDVLLAETEAGTSDIRLRPGAFLVLFPEDAHAPGCLAGGPCHVKKIIGKVRLREEKV